jgi:hypothetical protein
MSVAGARLALSSRDQQTVRIDARRGFAAIASFRRRLSLAWRDGGARPARAGWWGE